MLALLIYLKTSTTKVEHKAPGGCDLPGNGEIFCVSVLIWAIFGDRARFKNCILIYSFILTTFVF